MSVGSYCRRGVATAEPDETLRAAAQRMEKEGVGSLVVIDEDRPVGVLTDRDIVLRVVAEGGDPDETRVRSALGRPAVTIDAEARLADAAERMMRRRVRRLPVVDQEERVVGLVATDDLVRLLAEEITGLARVSASQLPVAASTGAEAAGPATAGLEPPPGTRTADHYRREVHCLREDTSARALAQLMKDRSVGCVVVTGDGEDAVGVVTDRDLVTRLVARGSDPDATPVHTIMTAPAVTAEPTDRLEEVVAKMSSRGVRRLPIVTGGRAVGMVSYDDLLVTFGRELVALGEAARAEVQREQLAARADHVRREVEANLREIGNKVAELGTDSVETLRKEVESLWERIRPR